MSTHNLKQAPLWGVAALRALARQPLVATRRTRIGEVH